MPTVSRTAASLRIIGDNLVPEEISRLLNKQPDAAVARGETVLSKSGAPRVAHTGRWSLKTERSTSGDLDSQIQTLLAGTTTDINVWQNITSRFQADVFCGLFLQEMNEGLVISPITLKLLGDRGIELSLDVYAGPDHES